MASLPSHRGTHPLDRLLRGEPGYWLAVLAIASPWVRLAVGSWTLYPGHVAIGLLLGAVVVSNPGWREALRPMAPLLMLGAYLAAVSSARGEWHAAVVFAALTMLHFGWGAAAMRLGMAGEAAAPLTGALAGLLASSLVAGLVGWGAQAWWPPACRVLNCAEQALPPYAFTGGWGNADRFLLLLLFLLAPLGGVLLASARPQARRSGGWQIPVLLAGAGMALLAGAAWWTLLLVGVGWLLVYREVAVPGGPGRRALLHAVAMAAAFAFVFIFGLEPGYFQRLWAGHARPPTVRVTLPGALPRGLSSDTPALLRLELTNTGWRTLESPPEAPLTLRTRLLVTPERGITRSLSGSTVALLAPLPPGATRTVELLVRVPPWIRDGYLTWELHLADGRTVPLERASAPGFRFINAGHRRLALDPENQLTALASRARTFADDTLPPEANLEPRAAGAVLGDMLDTLFFSPLWGQPTGGGMPFASERAFLPTLVHHYGLIGLALALWVAWRLFRRAVACGEPGHPAWALAPVAVVLLLGVGMFTQAPAAYHGHWAFFLLAGFLEGRYAQKFPWPRLQVAPPRPRLRRFRLRLPFGTGAGRSATRRRAATR